MNIYHEQSKCYTFERKLQDFTQLQVLIVKKPGLNLKNAKKVTNLKFVGRLDAFCSKAQLGRQISLPNYRIYGDCLPTCVSLHKTCIWLQGNKLDIECKLLHTSWS